MKTIAYCNPFVPPEWIAAHGLRPRWLPLRRAAHPSTVGVGRGLCPYAGALIDAASGDPCADSDLAAVVVTTACDQMRFAAALVEQRGGLPVFLLNMPSTWETAHARDLYRDELARLGRFLDRLDGQTPAAAELARVMIDYDQARAKLRQAAAGLNARQLVEAVARVRSGQAIEWPAAPVAPSGVALALLGGPLLEQDYALLDLLEQAGGRVVLDATEAGQRTLPAAFRRARLADEPLEELADAYFHAIPDVFRRPNDRLYDWLGRHLAACHARGVVLRRYVGCDLWHAEVQRLRQWCPTPVLDIDLDGDDRAAVARTLSRIEAFIEMLQ